MIDAKLISLLRCPVDGSQLELADAVLVEQVNNAIVRGEIRDRGDQKVATQIEGGLVASKGNRFYPIRGRIPTLIADEAIDLASVAR